MGGGRGRARGTAGDVTPRAHGGSGTAASRAGGREAPRGERGARAALAGEDPDEYRACARKRRYATSVEAKRAADQASRRKDAPRLYVYACAYCGGWHLTHHRRQA